MASKKRLTKRKASRLSRILITCGAALSAFGLLFIAIIFYPVAVVELRYLFDHNPIVPVKTQAIVPVDTDFGIVVPKIRANSHIVANVDPYNSREYQVALTKGVAHAKGTANPGQTGNVFLFSHSSANFYEATLYNSIFYLLSKLEKNDEIDLYYKGEKFVYSVLEKKLVAASSVQYLTAKTNKKTVTLMTCWPPGTTYERLIILAELKP